MKYEAEIDELLKTLLPKESWMSDEEYGNILNETLNSVGANKEMLSDQIEKGIENGYPLEKQIQILKKILK